MSRYFNRQSVQQQQRVAKHVKHINADHFFDLLTGPELFETLEAQLPEHREREYPPTTTLAMFLGQVMSADGSCQNAVDQALVQRQLHGLQVSSADTGGYCRARKRLPTELIRGGVRRLGQLLGEATPAQWLWRGRHVKLADGSTVSLPDTPDNQARYPQHAGQARGAGFPQARVVGVISLANGATLDLAMGPCQGKGTGEYALFRELQDSFCSGDVMLADRYYCSYFLLCALRSRGADAVFEQHGARHTDFRRGQCLGPREHLVSWHKPLRPDWMSDAEYQLHPDTLTVREVKVAGKVLVTTLLSPREVSRRALGELFWQRWNVELDLRNIKSTLGMDTLSCKTPAMCEKELWVYLLAYNLIRLLMAQAAHQAQVSPRQLSFKHTLQIWVAWNQQQFYCAIRQDTTIMFALIAQIRVADRPGRVEPRAVKRRPKPYPLLSKPRRQARADIRRHGHAKKLAA